MFIHSGWRCSSTYVWSRFRALPATRAYYEPWHEALADLTPEMIGRHTPDASRLGHPGGAQPYLAEFSDLLASGGGVAGYQARFALDDYFLEPEAVDPEQAAYVQGLVGAARSEGRVPVLACCRTLGKVAWLRGQVGGFHIVLIRDPVQQWLSFYSLRKRPRPTYFEQCQYLILSETQRGAPAAALLGAPRVSGALKARIAALRRRLKRAPDEVSFAAFIAVYVLSYLKALAQADLVIDIDRLGADPAYGREVSAAVAAATGLAPDFSDCRALTPHPDASGVAYRHQARRIIQSLGPAGKIPADGPCRLLFSKLSSALAHLDAAPPRPKWRAWLDASLDLGKRPWRRLAPGDIRPAGAMPSSR
ncbi:MAG: hypothetical protein KKC14_10345 [Alphaproteobacteria bacterium]|nr:hypothetical protein [Alphaproteobacteria bacterium]